MHTLERSVSLRMLNGTLEGVVCVEETNWSPGIMYAAPRGQLTQLKDAITNDAGCLYVLLSHKRVSIGQSSSTNALFYAIGQEAAWWERLVILSTKDSSLTRADLDYLEVALVSRARERDAPVFPNKPRSAPRGIGSYRREYLNAYLNTALTLMHLVRVDQFFSSAQTPDSTDQAARQQSDARLRQQAVTRQRPRGIRQNSGERLRKSEALQFVRDHGIEVGRDTSFATLQKDMPVFWINPRVDLLSRNWHLVLNDNRSFELIILLIPAKTIRLKQGHSDGVKRRADKPDLIDLRINLHSLVDENSRTSFSSFLVTRIPY